MQPLEGVKVLDFSQAAFGPVATRLLGDLGADIIISERPEQAVIRARSVHDKFHQLVATACAVHA